MGRFGPLGFRTVTKPLRHRTVSFPNVAKQLWLEAVKQGRYSLGLSGLQTRKVSFFLSFHGILVVLHLEFLTKATLLAPATHRTSSHTTESQKPKKPLNNKSYKPKQTKTHQPPLSQKKSTNLSTLTHQRKPTTQKKNKRLAQTKANTEENKKSKNKNLLNHATPPQKKKKKKKKTSNSKQA